MELSQTMHSFMKLRLILDMNCKHKCVSVSSKTSNKAVTLTSCAPISLVFISTFFFKRFLMSSRLIFHSERPEIIGRKALDDILLSPANTTSCSIIQDVMSVERVSSVNKQFQLRSMNVKSFKLCTSGHESLSVKSVKIKKHWH